MARWLGIDVSDSAVRVLLLRSSYRRNSVEAMVEEKLVDHPTPSAAIRAATHGLKADLVASSIVGQRGFFRSISLPSAAQKELQNILSYEVESTLPFELDDAVMDHRVLQHRPGVDEPDTLPIFAGVAYADEVRERIALITRGFGHEPTRVGLGPLPLSNLTQVMPELARSEAVAIVELEDRHTDVAILVNGETRFARSLSRGLVGLPGEAPALARELRQTLAAWRVRSGVPVTQLYRIGSGQQITGLDHFLQMELGVTIDSLPRPTLDGLSDVQLQALPRFAKALALALGLSRRSSDLNLRQGSLAAQQSYPFLREKVPLLAGLGAAILVSFGFSVVAEMRALEAEKTSLGEQLALTTETHFGESTKDPAAAEALLDATITGKNVDIVPRMDGFGVMVAISQRIPSDIIHDIVEFDYNGGKVTLRGIVPSIKNAHSIAELFEEEPCFRDVNLTRTTQLKKEGTQKYTMEFNVKCPIGKKKLKPHKVAASGSAAKAKTPPQGGR